jgi:hypothetical protein
VSIHVHIDRLTMDADVLAGSPPLKVQRAIEVALVAQLGAPGAAAALRNLGHADAMPSHVVPGGPQPLGARVANALSQALGVSAPKGGARG